VNALHLCFAQQLANEHFSAIITPNYDVAFDHALKQIGYKGVIRTEEDYQNNGASLNGVYFKIHGTVEDGYEETMVFTMTQEKLLSLWKRELLKKIIANRIIIFAGYSARDFDICPFIAELNSYKKIIWLQYADNEYKEQLSAYAARLLQTKAVNQIIAGDICLFANMFFNESISLKIKPSFNPSEHFTLQGEQQLKWQLNILDRIACASIGKRLLFSAEKELSEEYRLNIYHRMYGHTGEYKKAAKIALSLAKRHPINSKLRIKALLAASGSLLSRGSYYKSFNLLSRAKKLSLKYFPADSELALLLTNHELTFLMLIGQLTNRTGLRWLRKRVIRKAEQLHKQASEKLASIGTWEERQSVQHNLKRLTLSDKASFSLSAHDGYKNLGLHGMAIIAYRDIIRYERWTPDHESLRQLEEYIKRAEHLGMHTELWKLCRLRFMYENTDSDIRRKYWTLWKQNLAITEYRLPRYMYTRIELLFHRFSI
jgi:hypothetical protein